MNDRIRILLHLLLFNLSTLNWLITVVGQFGSITIDHLKAAGVEGDTSFIPSWHHFEVIYDLLGAKVWMSEWPSWVIVTHADSGGSFHDDAVVSVHD